MTTPFQLQLLTSFLVGGGAVALISLLAERASARTAGFLLSLPTTVAIGTFFIGWTLGPEGVAKAIPVMPLSLGIDVAYTAVYVYVARLQLAKRHSVMTALGSALSFWALLALPVAMYEVSDLRLSLLVYVVFTIATHFLLIRLPCPESESDIVRYTPLQKAARAMVSGSLIVLIVYLSKTLGPVWGGVFSMFPAANTSAMVIIHWQRDVGVLTKVCRMIPLGSPTFLVYVFAALWAFPRFGIVMGTVISYGITAAFLLALADTVNPNGRVRRILAD